MVVSAGSEGAGDGEALAPADGVGAAEGFGVTSGSLGAGDADGLVGVVGTWPRPPVGEHAAMATTRTGSRRLIVRFVNTLLGSYRVTGT